MRLETGSTAYVAVRMATRMHQRSAAEINGATGTWFYAGLNLTKPDATAQHEVNLGPWRFAKLVRRRVLIPGRTDVDDAGTAVVGFQYSAMGSFC